MSSKEFGFIALGLGVGAAVGLLYAPRSGRVTRRFVRARANTAAGYVKDQGEQLKKAAVEKVERGKRTILDTKTHIEAAVEAGREAYREANAAFAADRM
ncbi:MAG: YtxH domain-containing protein [Acidobacteriota bacterium]